jgi:hypothetical protein
LGTVTLSYTRLLPSIVVTPSSWASYCQRSVQRDAYTASATQGRLIELQGPQCVEDAAAHHGDDALDTQLTCWCRPSSSTLFLSKKLGEVADHRTSHTAGHLCTGFRKWPQPQPRSRSKKLNAIPYLQTTNPLSLETGHAFEI